jgi:hypothetical protein
MNHLQGIIFYLVGHLKYLYGHLERHFLIHHLTGQFSEYTGGSSLCVWLTIPGDMDTTIHRWLELLRLDLEGQGFTSILYLKDISNTAVYIGILIIENSIDTKTYDVLLNALHVYGDLSQEKIAT